MNVKKASVFILCFAILFSLLHPKQSFAKWAYAFVVYDGYTYVLSEESVTDIDKEIGEVTKYSDIEGTYSGNFSNEYHKGTKYYSIKGISTDQAIAVADHGHYKKAERRGKYEGKKVAPIRYIETGLIIFVIVVLLMYAFRSIKARR
ncbi:hypothetical protein [Bacillus sp. MUM 13]|uniref:hypothetical protein n=1 Tax=Bacillus sp. MUM 13 TaxID=1678001 RepID=UPI00111438E9|nr:hypothetical protein [Bacillus sp. MUM 13]